MSSSGPRMQIDADSPNLDVLRACAVLVVLAFHTVGFFNRGLASNLGLEQLGRLAVLFFFVHTCLVLMLSLERQTAKFGLHNLHWIFMTRRAFRVYPLSIAVVLAVFLLGLPVAGPPWAMHPQHLTARGLLANVLLLQNVTMSGSVVIPLWSLPYEIQMYLVLPAIFLLVRRFPSWRWVMALWAVSAGIAFCLSRLLVNSHRAYFEFAPIVEYVPCFLPGVVAYRLAATSRPRLPAFAWPLTLLGLALLYVVTHGRDHGWVICLLTGLAIPRFEPIKSAFWKSACHFIAKYSYGLYLSHIVSLWLSFTRLAFLPMPLRWAVFVTTVVGVPLTLYHSLEAPLIRFGNALVANFSQTGL